MRGSYGHSKVITLASLDNERLMKHRSIMIFASILVVAIAAAVYLIYSTSDFQPRIVAASSDVRQVVADYIALSNNNSDLRINVDNQKILDLVTSTLAKHGMIAKTRTNHTPICEDNVVLCTVYDYKGKLVDPMIMLMFPKINQHAVIFFDGHISFYHG